MTEDKGEHAVGACETRLGEGAARSLRGTRYTLRTAAWALLVPASLGAQAPARGAEPPGLRVERAFPHAVLEPWSARGLRLAPAADLAASFTDARRVRLTDVPWPGPAGEERLELELERWQAMSPDMVWAVDGVASGGRGDIDRQLFLYAGRVSGEPDSYAYLALAETGSLGWISRGTETVHLLSGPDERGSWERPQVFLVHQSDPSLPESPGFTCGTPPVVGLLAEVAPVPPGPPGGKSGSRADPIYECLLALETDWQFFQLFGNVTAATNYAVALFGAVSERFHWASNTFITLPYLGIWSTPNDPWTSQDNGGGSGNVLDEFRLAWGGRPFPGNAHLAHLISGANLGGGVAYVDVLCNRNFGFAVSGNLHGQNPFPVPQIHNLNWDFFVSAHETGHNFGSPHTHEYCPPLDQCAGGFGSCQTAQVCQVGTIMSYCHGCPGGMLNISAEFHPTTGALMRSRVVQSCLPFYPPAAATPRNGLGGNPQGFVSWTPPAIGAMWWTAVDLAPVSAQFSVLAAVVTGPMQGVFWTWGEILLDLRGPFVAPLQTAQGVHAVAIPNDSNLLGVVLYTQAATVGPAGIQLQNALDAQLGY